MLLAIIDMCVKHINSLVNAAMTKVCIHYIFVCPFSFARVYTHIQVFLMRTQRKPCYHMIIMDLLWYISLNYIQYNVISGTCE